MFENKVVWVTGASSGIGKGIIEYCSRYNCKLVISSRKKKDLEKLVANFKLDKGNILILPFDYVNLSEEESNDLLKKVLTKFQRLDYFFNNAGVDHRGKALNTQIKVLDRLLKINTISHLYLTHVVANYMQKQTFPTKIVPILSLLSLFSIPYTALYSSSKHALRGFYKALQLELKRQKSLLKIVMVSPGYVQTNISLNSMLEDGSLYNKTDVYTEQGLPLSLFIKKMMQKMKCGKLILLYLSF